MKFMKIFKKKQPDKIFHLRKMDFSIAEKFYQDNKNDIRNMYLSLEDDATGTDVREEIVEDGALIQNPISLDTIENVGWTCFGVPCIVVEYNSGVVKTLKCFKTKLKNITKNQEYSHDMFGREIYGTTFGCYTGEEAAECRIAFDAIYGSQLEKLHAIDY